MARLCWRPSWAGIDGRNGKNGIIAGWIAPIGGKGAPIGNELDGGDAEDEGEEEEEDDEEECVSWLEGLGDGKLIGRFEFNRVIAGERRDSCCSPIDAARDNAVDWAR